MPELSTLTALTFMKLNMAMNDWQGDRPSPLQLAAPGLRSLLLVELESDSSNFSRHHRCHSLSKLEGARHHRACVSMMHTNDIAPIMPFHI